MKVICVIPARYASSRLPGKPLADICGKPMIRWVYEQAQQAKLLEKARKMEFPFICFKLDESQKSPYLVDIIDLAFVLNKRYEEQAKEYATFMKGALTASQN